MKRSAILAATGAAAVMAASLGGIVAASTADAASCMKFSFIQYNTPGNDLPVTNAKLNNEYVRMHNYCTKSISMTGFRLRDEGGHYYTFPATTAGPGATVTVHTGSGSNTSTDKYWGSGYYVWNNDGDRARLWRPSGGSWILVDECSWGDGPGSTTC